MNQAQVNQEWWQHARFSRPSLQRSFTETEQRRREQVAWCERAFPALCPAGSPCPFLLEVVGRLWHLRGTGEVTRPRIVEARRGLIRRSFRGDEVAVAEYEELFETAEVAS